MIELHSVFVSLCFPNILTSQVVERCDECFTVFLELRSPWSISHNL